MMLAHDDEATFYFLILTFDLPLIIIAAWHPIKQKNVNDFLAELSKSWEEPPPFFVTSAVKRTGAKQLLQFISEMNKRDLEI